MMLISRERNEPFYVWSIVPSLLDGIVFDDVDYSEDVKNLLNNAFSSRVYTPPMSVDLSNKTDTEKLSIVSQYFENLIEEYYNEVKYDYNCIFSALNLSYNPIENTDKYETDTVTESGSDVLAKSHTNTNEISGTVTTNEDVTVSDEKESTITGENSNSSTTNYGKTETTSQNAMTGTETDRTSTSDGTETNVSSGSDTITHSKNVYNETSSDMIPSERDSTTHGKNDALTKNLSDTTRETQNVETSGGTDITNGGRDSVSESGDTSTHDITSAINATDRTTATTNASTETQTESSNDTQTYGHVVTTEIRSHGNIGVTTNQQMLESEIVMRKKHMIFNFVLEFVNRYTTF